MNPLQPIRTLAAAALVAATTVAQAVDCGPMPAWSSSVQYLGNSQVQRQNAAYRANWWNENKDPLDFSGPWQEWTKLGTCTSQNQSPTTSLTSPAANAQFAEGAPVTLAATASDSDGTVANVEFFVDGVSQGSDVSAPYNLTWTARAGSHTAYTVATDNLGAKTTSASVSFSVQGSGNQSPTVSLTAPTEGDSFGAGSVLSFAANAADSDGTIRDVTFYLDGTPVGTDSTAPYTVSWTATAGAHQLYARATDNLGATSTSSAVSFKVDSNQGLPVKGTLQIQNWDHAASFFIEWNKWYGTSATAWELYEDGIKVQSGTLSDVGNDRQTVRIQISDKKLGVYTYQLKETNAAGSTWTDAYTTWVGDASLVTIPLWDKGGQVFQQTLALGETVTVDLKAVDVAAPSFTVASNNLSVAMVGVSGTRLTVQAVAPGRAGIRIREAGGQTRWIGIRVKNADGSLPGLPNYVSIGAVSDDGAPALNTWREFGVGDLNTRVDFRYIYLNNGPDYEGNTDASWCRENYPQKPKCYRATRYIRESMKLGMIPIFVFYNIASASESYDKDLQHIQDPGYMAAYFREWAKVIGIANAEAGDDPVGYVIEPDFLGYMMQNSGKQPAEIMARVDQAYAAGVLDTTKGDPQFPNTIEGLVKAVNYLIKRDSRNAWFGWQINVWSDAKSGASTKGLMHATDPEERGWTAGRQLIAASAKRVADYYQAAGITSYGANFISFDKYGLDGGKPDIRAMWHFNADHWNNYLHYVQVLHTTLQKPVVLWQLPAGHINGTVALNPYTSAPFATLSNAGSRQYEDSGPSYFFGDTFTAASSAAPPSFYLTNVAGDPGISGTTSRITWSSHLEAAKRAGVVTLLFGAGVGDSTDNVGMNGLELTDDHWWLVKTQRYYQNGVVPLP